MQGTAERPAHRRAGVEEVSHVDLHESLDLRLEAGLVALTLVSLVGGVLAERAGAPAPAWIAFGVAYLAGGAPAARTAVASLAHRHLDVDVLMVLAALGALVIGAPSEGATLLFLFSLSNLLQRVALGRSRRAIRALMLLRPD